jgi:hypothetical protein
MFSLVPVKLTIDEYKLPETILHEGKILQFSSAWFKRKTAVGLLQQFECHYGRVLCLKSY